MNAPSEQRLRKGDGLILLARRFEDTNPARGQTLEPLHRRPRNEGERPPSRHRRILILGWNHRVPALLQELDSYPGETADVTVASFWPVEDRQNMINGYVPEPGRVGCQHVKTDFLMEGEIARLAPERYDTVMLLTSDRMGSNEEADARAMVGYLQLQDHLQQAGTWPQILLELTDPHNEALLLARNSEIFLSPVMLSHLLAQVALRRELRLVYDELFTQGGAEIGFRALPAELLAADTDFRAAAQSVATSGETALGIHRAQPTPEGRHLTLNPDPGEPLNLSAGDQLVVLGRELERH